MACSYDVEFAVRALFMLLDPPGQASYDQNPLYAVDDLYLQLWNYFYKPSMDRQTKRLEVHRCTEHSSIYFKL